jgi:hypothetical protein
VDGSSKQRLLPLTFSFIKGRLVLYVSEFKRGGLLLRFHPLLRGAHAYLIVGEDWRKARLFIKAGK